MAGWHHRLDGHEFEWTPAVGDGQGGLACCNSWGRRARLNWTECLYCLKVSVSLWTDLVFCCFCCLIVHFTQNFKFNCVIFIIKLYYYNRYCKTHIAVVNGIRDPVYLAASINHLQYIPMYPHLPHISANRLMWR